MHPQTKPRVGWDHDSRRRRTHGGAGRGRGTAVIAVPLVVETPGGADRDAVRVRGHDVLLEGGVGARRHPTRGGVRTRRA